MILQDNGRNSGTIKAATLIRGSECKNPGSRRLSKERPLETSACLPVPPLFVGSGPSLPCSVAAPGAAPASPTVQCGSWRPPLQRAQTANSGSVCTALSLPSQRMHGRGGHGSPTYVLKGEPHHGTSAQENQRDERVIIGAWGTGSKPQGASPPSCLCHVANSLWLDAMPSSPTGLSLYLEYLSSLNSLYA